MLREASVVVDSSAARASGTAPRHQGIPRGWVTMNTIEDDEEVETGNLVHRRRRSKPARHDEGQGAQLQGTALCTVENVLQATNAEEAEPVAKRGPTGQDVGRNRASPARLFKLNKELSSDQVALIKAKHFGGLLNIVRILPSEMSKWLVSTYSTDTRELLIPENGSIAVTANSVYRNFKLPKQGWQSDL